MSDLADNGGNLSEGELLEALPLDDGLGVIVNGRAASSLGSSRSERLDEIQHRSLLSGWESLQLFPDRARDGWRTSAHGIPAMNNVTALYVARLYITRVGTCFSCRLSQVP